MPEGRGDEPAVVRGDTLRNFLKLHARVVPTVLLLLYAEVVLRSSVYVWGGEAGVLRTEARPRLRPCRAAPAKLFKT